MALEVFKKMRYGRAAAVGLFFVSIICIGLNLYLMVSEGKYLPKFLMLGILSLFLSVALFVFPGGKFTQNDYPDERIGLKFFWKNSPKLHRAVWVIALICGVVAAFYIEHNL
jgi:hypothetical protein